MASVTGDEQTFLIADMAGFTALTEAHGDEFAADAASEFYVAVRRLLSECGAEEVKTLGDAVLLRVAEPAGAVRLAVRIIEEVGARHGVLGVRVALHSGPAVSRDGDWYGATVNLTARLADLASRGEILMTAATRQAAGEALDDYAMHGRGPQRFKNVAEQVEVYALVLATQPNAADLPLDPVCRMAVDPARSSERRTYREVTYHFCSRECGEIFDRAPARYHGPDSER